MKTINWNDFEKVEFRTGTIIEVKDFPEALKPAYKLGLSSNYCRNLYYEKNYPLNLDTFIWKYAVCTYMQVIPSACRRSFTAFANSFSGCEAEKLGMNYL